MSIPVVDTRAEGGGGGDISWPWRRGAELSWDGGLCCVKNKHFYGQSWWQAHKITDSSYKVVYKEIKE